MRSGRERKLSIGPRRLPISASSRPRRGGGESCVEHPHQDAVAVVDGYREAESALALDDTKPCSARRIARTAGRPSLSSLQAIATQHDEDWSHNLGRGSLELIAVGAACLAA